MKAARRTTETDKPLASPALTVSIKIDPLVKVVRRHVKLGQIRPRLRCIRTGTDVQSGQSPATRALWLEVLGGP